MPIGHGGMPGNLLLEPAQPFELVADLRHATVTGMAARLTVHLSARKRREAASLTATEKTMDGLPLGGLPPQLD